MNPSSGSNLCDWIDLSPQVKVLQLETQLEQERVRLGELRKRHYVYGGPGATGGSENDSESFPPPPPPTLLDSTLEAQAFSQAQPYLNTQNLPPVTPFSPAPTQPYLMPQSHTPAHTYSQSHIYTPSTQTYTPSTQTYIPPAQTYTPSAQTYTPPQAFPSSRPYIPAQPIVLTPTPNYFNSQANSPSPSSGRAHSPSLSKKSPQNSAEAGTSSSKKPNIFTKSGKLLKNAVSSGSPFVTPPSHTASIYIPLFFFYHSSRKMRVEREQSLKALT